MRTKWNFSLGLNWVAVAEVARQANRWVCGRRPCPGELQCRREDMISNDWAASVCLHVRRRSLICKANDVAVVGSFVAAFVVVVEFAVVGFGEPGTWTTDRPTWILEWLRWPESFATMMEPPDLRILIH